MSGRRRAKQDGSADLHDSRSVKPFLSCPQTNADSDKLRESEEKFRILTETSAAAIFFHQGKKFIYANPAAEKITGYTHDELLNMSFWEFVAPECRETVKNRGLARLSGDDHIPHYEVKIITKQGIERWLDLSSARMEYRGTPAIMATAMDITQRKQAEKALRLAKFTIDSASDEVFWIGPNGHILDVNKAACAALGYTSDELSNMYIWDIDPNFPAEIWAAHWRELKERRVLKFESNHRTKDGRIFPTEVTVSHLEFEGNEYDCAIARDITERKQAEDAMRKSDVRFRSLIQNSSDIIRILDNEGCIIFDSDSSEKILGYPPGYTLGKSTFDFIHPDDVKTVQKELGTVLDKRNSGIPTEFRIRKADGEYLWVESIGLNMTGVPGVDGIVITTRPIGERKKAEEALRKNEEMLRRVIDFSPVAIALHNGDGKVIYINKKFTETFGYTIEDVPGINEWWMLAYPDEEYREFVKKRWDSAIDYAIRNKASIPPREVEVTCKDGSKKQILSEFSSIGSVYMSVLYDFTERKKSEEELKAAKQQADLYLDLMGHDINNLHQIALGYLELARDMPAGEEQAIFLDKPVEVLQRSAQLIQNVRKLQKLRDGLFKTELVDVCKVLSDVRREFGAVPDKLVTLNFNGRERCFVLANELLHDVFANLVSNAIKHTGGRAEIVIDLDVINDNGGRYCRVFVEDNGPGVPDEFKAKIFDRTLKGTNNAKGMGLGLYLVKSLVDSYGGRVWVEDRVFGDHTKGARFVVMLHAVEKR